MAKKAATKPLPADHRLELLEGEVRKLTQKLQDLNQKKLDIEAESKTNEIAKKIKLFSVKVEQTVIVAVHVDDTNDPKVDAQYIVEECLCDNYDPDHYEVKEIKVIKDCLPRLRDCFPYVDDTNYGDHTVAEWLRIKGKK